ncbi:glycerol-3-phosphate dehydrogenase, mitochondrial-like isoform X2 [Dermacentor albipictus]|uniref:glycerol-3-phosphate dehydrogenase, mitochondrial-like isoform X2 n=1 Tax=Dermacentor albipictus TaxID=60249 RepID=UPI0031FD03B7
MSVGRVALAAAGHCALLWALSDPLIVPAPTTQQRPPDTVDGGVPFLKILPTRDEQLQKLRTTLQFDVMVLGGGAIACGVALDAATRGLHVAMCDVEDFGSGASTRGCKLLPATARGYSEPMVPFHLKLFKGNRQAIEERQAIFNSAPHLCHPVTVVMPLYDWRKALSVWFYFKTHWYTFSKPNLNDNRWLSSAKTQELLPLLRKDKLVGSVLFREATIDDIRMNVALALTAARHGAVVVNHVGCKRFLKDKFGRLRGVVLIDKLTGEKWPVRAKCVINVTGHSADYLRQVDTPSAKAIGNPVLSTYMVLPWHFGHKTCAILTATDKGTLIAMPYQEQCLISGSHKKLDFTQAGRPTHEAVSKMLRDWNEQLDMNAVTAKLSEVLSTWTTVTSVQESVTGREKPVIEVSQSGMVSCTGGAWTWNRLLAERVVDTALTHCEELQPCRPCSTRAIKLEGAANWSPTLYVQLLQKYRLEADVSKHLVDYYGDQAALLARMAANSRKGSRSLNPGQRLLPRLSFIEAEVRHAVRHEYACTAVDVLARRLGVAYADANAAEGMLPRVVDIMAAELGWTAAQRQDQMQQATRFLEENMGLAVCRPHRHAPVLRLDSNEFGRLVRLFQYLDRRQVEALSKALQLNADTLAETLDEMESATSGSLELGDFLLFMNNLKVCLRAQHARAAKRDPSMNELVELRGSDPLAPLPRAPTVYTM